ncbi:hypothetical protein RND71_034562 [Anisodus tanguticus]|uniref:Uncharacterized protein n=1 Tax=Anisodus tanguticus TaxID=243964 RepID=A0AAE1RAY9_9SOLA|nr:hypothetical protein RND71_034562 [Anisodus tanguticus]
MWNDLRDKLSECHSTSCTLHNTRSASEVTSGNKFCKHVKKYGLEWYTKFKPKKYHLETRIDEAILQAHHPDIVEQIYDQGCQFVYEDPGEYNIHLVREVYANWVHDDPNEICVRGVMVSFTNKKEVDEEPTNSRLPVLGPGVDVTWVKNPKDLKGQTLTTMQQHARDDSIMANMYDL